MNILIQNANNSFFFEYKYIFIYIYIEREREKYMLSFSLTKRSFKGFLLNVLKAGRCVPPRLVPPGASPMVPPSKYPKLKVPPIFSKFAKFPRF